MINKQDLNQRRRNLSDQQRALLQKRLQGQLKNLKPADKAPSQIPKKPDDALPILSFSQQRLWFLAQLEEASAVYNIPQALHVTGCLNVTALEQSLNTVIARHAILRTTFTLVNRQLTQQVASSLRLAMPLLDLTSLSESDRAQQVEKIGAEMAHCAFNLETGPLLQAKVVKLASNEHLLFLTVHHIIFDKWSSDLLWQELAGYYTAFDQNTTPTWVAPNRDYADFAHWQQQRLQGAYLEKLTHYWQNHLSSNPPTLPLATDYPRPAIQSFTGGNVGRTLSRTLLNKLQALSRQADTTLYMTLLAAFKLLLYRYTGQTSLVVGTPIANRNHPDLETMIGFFVNTLVLRTDLDADLPFSALLSRVRETTLGAYSHQDMPFEKLVEIINPNRDLSRNPLFQVMFVFQNQQPQMLAFPGLTVHRHKIATEVAKFDLSLEISEGEQGLRTRIEYNARLFAPETIERMLDHYESLLQGVVAHPEQPLKRLPLLTATDHAQFQQLWAGTQVDYDAVPIHRLFEAQVTRTPQAIALYDRPHTLTYLILNHRANQLAHHLISMGVTVETIVGICLPRSFDMVVALLAILKAGGAYLPLDPSYPTARLHHIITDAQPNLIITNRHETDHFTSSNTPYICLDEISIALSECNPENPNVTLTADNLAYVLYTSGSTGQPKGVMGLHRGAVNRFQWMWRTYPFQANEICCQKTTLNFVDSVWEIFGPLLQGVPSVLISDETRQDPHQFIQTLRQHQVTRIVLVPSLLRVLLATNPQLATELPHLKYWITSGETLSVELANRFLKQLPNRILLNLYGSSEVAADVTAFEVKANQFAHTVPIGRPIDNTQIYILDPQQNLIPLGCPGEIYVAGAGLARGYHNQPDITAARFVQNPFAQTEAELAISPYLYRTGDRGRLRLDKQNQPIIEYLGRQDKQVKIRGVRVELGEVEFALSQQPDLLTATVVSTIAASGQTELVAYVVPKPQHEITTIALRQFLTESLPSAMIPTTFILLASLPLTPNGKVDYASLPKPDQGQRDESLIYVPPRNDLEQRLVQLWQTVLRVEKVGVTDNFFDLGGHSLLAVDLFGQLEDMLDLRLPLVTLFQAPTIRQLAQIITQEGWQPPQSALVPIQPRGDKPPFFCVTPPLGNALGFSRIAQALGSNQPFYALHYQGFDHWEGNPQMAAEHPIIEIAAHYRQEIKKLQPHGPYFLGGRCYGGHIAFELAQQLVAEGETVALLALMTTTPLGFQRPKDYYLRRMRYHLRQGQLYPIVKRAFPRLVRRQIRRLRVRAKRTLGIGANGQPLAVAKSNQPLVNKPQQTVYPGRITLFETNNITEANWAALTSDGVELHLIPGSHLDVFHEPNVQILAQKLADSLAKTQGDHP